MLNFIKRQGRDLKRRIRGEAAVAVVLPATSVQRNDPPTAASASAEKPADDNLIDVRRLVAQLSVEELCEAAEEYFRNIKDWNYYLAKPFANAGEMPEMIVPFAQLVQGLQLVPGMSVLDFGAGTCWSSRLLTQMGCSVIALDVSPTVLKVGRELYARQPIVGDQPAPRFLEFDGRKIDLPDASVDRIICLDAFHHVPNAATILAELGRVLCEGGIAAFSEPGPEHSKAPQSQYEMRMYRVVEDDVVIGDIWRQAQAVGFTDLKLAVFNPKTLLISLAEFEEYLAGGEPNRWFADAARHYMLQHRAFFLFKGEATAFDSRRREGLRAELKIDLSAACVSEGQPFAFSAVIANTGENVWLPTTAAPGAVHLGVHLFNAEGTLLDLDYMRHKLTPGAGSKIRPGETVSYSGTINPPPRGRYFIEFDLVSEGICWFESNGSQTVRLGVEVV